MKIFENYAKQLGLKISKQNYQTEYIPMQVWPEDTITINVTLSPIIDNIQTGLNFIIENFHLSQNYPNPFNNFTSFTYTLPKSDFVEISVYSITGKLIEKLFVGEQKPGEYKVHWNAESVASGIYIYQLKANDLIINKKCVLIK